MNCVPGDLAVVVKSMNPSRLGVIVRVVGPALNNEPGWWTVESPNNPPPTAAGWKARDAWLRPIRDPGEDSKDETLSWKPLPLPEIVPALLDRETA